MIKNSDESLLRCPPYRSCFAGNYRGIQQSADVSRAGGRCRSAADTIAENPKRWAPVTQQADSEKNFMTREAEAEGGEGVEEKASDSRQFHLGGEHFH